LRVPPGRGSSLTGCQQSLTGGSNRESSATRCSMYLTSNCRESKSSK
jgi:hypothetical protein